MVVQILHVVCILMSIHAYDYTHTHKTYCLSNAYHLLMFMHIVPRTLVEQRCCTIHTLQQNITITESNMTLVRKRNYGREQEKALLISAAMSCACIM